MKVRTPNKSYTGVSAGVEFCNGVGETDDMHLLDWFRQHGYDVDGSEAPVKKAGTKKAGE